MIGMNEKKKYPFKKNETGFHKYAVKTLAEWVNGECEKPFYVEGLIVFVPDVIVINNGIIDRIYEVVYNHPIDGKKLGLMQYWSYRNKTELNVFEVSTDFILKQTSKPDYIEILEYYNIEVLDFIKFEETEDLPY